MGVDDATRYADRFRLRSGRSEITAKAILFGPAPDASDSPSSAYQIDKSSIAHSTNRKGAAQNNAIIGGSVSLDHTIPAYGHAMGGKDGEFVLNGNTITEILAPAALRNVEDAYAVFVAGDSMEPRYSAGEAVFIHPRLPVRKGDFVVAQIQGKDGEPPLAYVKRFVSMSGERLILEQLNPVKRLIFNATRVVSIHLIVFSGRAF